MALPAIGALFVAHLAHQDYERMVEEKQEGHRNAFLAFLVAFTFDVVSVYAGVRLGGFELAIPRSLDWGVRACRFLMMR